MKIDGLSLKLKLKYQHMRIKVSLFLSLFLLSAFFLSNCKKDHATRFLVKVDSIQMPDTIQFGDTLKIELFGTIGENGCYSLDKIEPVFEDSIITVSVWGLNSGSDVCPDVMVYLDGTTIAFTGLQKETYQIIFLQPDDGKLEQQVVVI